VRLLADTHTLIWWWAGDRKLSRRARAVLSDAANTVHVSAVSGYEIVLKQRRGLLPRGVPHDLAHAISNEGFAILPLKLEHTVAAAALSDAHRDPFDRLLIAQAKIEGLSIVSSDGVFGEYGVRVVW
jgi:PIN domain nuclease of toxin-antitoxin system